MQWKFQKKLRILEIIAFEVGTAISLNYDENTFDWQSTGYQTVLRFEMCSNSICIGLMENEDKAPGVVGSAVLGTPEHIVSGKIF